MPADWYYWLEAGSGFSGNQDMRNKKRWQVLRFFEKSWSFNLCSPILRCFLGLFLASLGAAGAWPPPVRAVAVTDVVDLRNGSFAIHEFIEVYNDDFNAPLTVTAALADTWVGRRQVRLGENWLPGEASLVIPPAGVLRVAERQRIITGQPRRNWWVRWLRFVVKTNRGEIPSNWISSPLHSPGRIVSDTLDQQIDSWSSPPGHASPPTSLNNPWKVWPDGW